MQKHCKIFITAIYIDCSCQPVAKRILIESNKFFTGMREARNNGDRIYLGQLEFIIFNGQVIRGAI